MRTTVRDFKKMKGRGEPIPMVTAYDYPTARLVDGAGIPLILVGDSLGQVVLGYETTIPVTMEEMLHHCRAVARGARQAMLVADMPFMTYHLDEAQCLRNAGRFLQEGGTQGVKLEGGTSVASKVRRLVECGIPVMGHIGLAPQSVYQFGGYRVQGRDLESARRLLEDAGALEEAGAFCIVLELVPEPLAREITRRSSVPTIGIGSGRHCDGQIQVLHDILGLTLDADRKHTKRFANLAETIAQALGQYASQVKEGVFPGPEHAFQMEEEVLKALFPEQG